MDFQKILESVCETNGWAMTHGEIAVTTPHGRAQRFRWKPFQDGAREMARVWTIIGPADRLTEVRQRAALGLNFSLPSGALAIADEQLCMTDTFLVGDADEREVEHALRSMAGVADRYERLLYGSDAH